MTEPVSTSSALFGPDGTQLPDPPPVLPDPLIAPFTGTQRSNWQDTPSSVPLPAVPDADALGEAMAAVFTVGLVANDEPANPAPPARAEPVAPAAGPPPAGGFPTQRPPLGPMRRPPPSGPIGARPPYLPTAAPPRVFPPVRPGGVSRGADRDLSARQSPGRWSSSAQTGCIIALIVFGLVVFNIIAGIIGSLSDLFQ